MTLRANEVAALRKPSVAAWAVNQIGRTQPKALRALFAAGNDLARAQARAAARAQKELASARVRREQVVGALEEAEALVSVAAQRAENAKTELTIAEQALRELGQ